MKKIAWEKINVEEEDILDVELLNSPEDIDQDEDIDHNFMSSQYEIIMPTIKINTPFGKYSIDDNFSPYKMFDCWICHTNFPITPLEHLILNEQIPGIGALKVLSKYRFCIGIEKLFTITQVREAVHLALCGDDDVSREAKRLNSIMSKISTQDNWAVFISDSGDVFSSSSDTDGELHVKNVSAMKKRKGGKLIICDKR